MSCPDPTTPKTNIVQIEVRELETNRLRRSFWMPRRHLDTKYFSDLDSKYRGFNVPQYLLVVA